MQLASHSNNWINSVWCPNLRWKKNVLLTSNFLRSNGNTPLNLRMFSFLEFFPGIFPAIYHNCSGNVGDWCSCLSFEIHFCRKWIGHRLNGHTAFFLSTSIILQLSRDHSTTIIPAVSWIIQKKAEDEFSRCSRPEPTPTQAPTMRGWGRFRRPHQPATGLLAGVQTAQFPI